MKLLSRKPDFVISKPGISSIETIQLGGIEHESAGKRKSTRSKKGNKYLRSALTEAAQSVRGSKNLSWCTV